MKKYARTLAVVIAIASSLLVSSSFAKKHAAPPATTYNLSLYLSPDGLSNSDGSASLCATDGNTGGCTFPFGRGSNIVQYPAGDKITVSVTETTDGACQGIKTGHGVEDFARMVGHVDTTNTSVTFIMPAGNTGETADYSCHIGIQ